MSIAKVVGRNPFTRMMEVTYPPSFTSTAFAATGDCLYYAGNYWNPYGVAKNIKYICFKFGTVTITTSGLTWSLQDVDTANGPPLRHDGTPDQTVAMAAGAIVANAWTKTNALSANRTVTPGDRLAAVCEFDGSGRQGSDSIGFSNLALVGSGGKRMQSIVGTKIGSTYTSIAVVPNIIFEHDDGTFGTLAGAMPCSAVNTHTFASTVEHALAFSLPYPFVLDEVDPIVNFANSNANANVILYQGTTSLQSTAVLGKTIESTGGARSLPLPLASQQNGAANTTYYLAVGPSTANNVSLYSVDVADANHLTLWPGGVNFSYATRANTGVGWTPTSTRRLLAWLSGIGFDDGAGGGGGLLRHPGMNGGLST